MDEVALIKAKIDIVDLIGSYVSLKRSGRGFVACCPFHQEKSPSFHVNSDRQSFHCFGCQKGGDIFTFMMEFENFSFKDALERLAAQAGIQLQASSGFSKDRELEKAWIRLLNCAGHFYRTQFVDLAGEKARDYMEKRGFTQSTIEQYKIGYAPDAWDNFCQHAQHKGFKINDLITMGLAKKNERGQVFDFFRNRVMFPVRNQQGQVVAFGGRVLDQSEPKYLNSPETPLFNKSKTLFNFSQARSHLREHGHFLLMEGYTDVMMASQFNLGPAIATLGTAMTEDHIRMIKRHDLPLFLVYDADRAGRNAMERALPFVLKYGLEARAVTLPNGQDPADFLLNNEHWKTLWKDLLQNSKDVFDYKLEALIAEKNLEPHESKIAIARIMMKDLELNRDPLRESVYIDSLANRLSIQREDIKSQLLSQRKEKEVPDLTQHRVPLPFKRDAPYFLLALCLLDSGFRAQLDEIKNLPFLSSPCAAVLKKWLDAHQNMGEIAHSLFESQLNDIEKDIFVHARIQEELPEKSDWTAFFEEKLQKWLLDKNDIEEINRQIEEAGAQNNKQRLAALFDAKKKIILAKQ